MVHILPVYVFSRPVDLRRYRKLVDAVKKVYPIAKIAKARMADMEEELCRLPTKRRRRSTSGRYTTRSRTSIRPC